VRCPVLLMLLALASVARAQSLPRVSDTDWPRARQRCDELLRVLRKHEGALPAEVERSLSLLLKEEPKEPDAALEKLQDLLDPLCLVGVHINPESRVKAARGALPAELTLDRPRVVLFKVHNEGGITAGLNVTGDELREPGRAAEGRWLEVSVLNEPPLRTLSGVRLEYVAVRLTPREAGKREATLKFDAGQGTQDLGFRAEVPILFRVGRP
jgi:hypothetical protein